MQEQIISFETAKLAKEKGFKLDNHSVLDYYKPDGSKLKLKEFSKEFIKFCVVYCTQSLLQKWLREVHNIHITIYSKSQESWMYRITKKGQSLKEGLYGEDFETYEQALEDGILEALKLLQDETNTN